MTGELVDNSPRTALLHFARIKDWIFINITFPSNEPGQLERRANYQMNLKCLLSLVSGDKTTNELWSREARISLVRLKQVY